MYVKKNAKTRPFLCLLLCVLLLLSACSQDEPAPIDPPTTQAESDSETAGRSAEGHRRTG